MNISQKEEGYQEAHELRYAQSQEDDQEVIPKSTTPTMPTFHE